MYFGAASDPLADLAAARARVREAMVALRDSGSIYLGRVQTYSTPEVARSFTDQFRAILKSAEGWLVAAGRAEKEPTAPDVVAALVAPGNALADAITRFNRTARWESPSNTVLLVKAPFAVAGAVTVQVARVLPRIGNVVLKAGESVLNTAGFLSRFAGPLLVLGVGAYFLAPWAIRQMRAARA